MTFSLFWIYKNELVFAPPQNRQLHEIGKESWKWHLECWCWPGPTPARAKREAAFCARELLMPWALTGPLMWVPGVCSSGQLRGLLRSSRENPCTFI